MKPLDTRAVNQRSLLANLLTAAPWILLLITAIVLLTNVPTVDTITQHLSKLLIFMLLTAYTLFLGVLLSEADLSPAHMVGILAFLSMPASATPALGWTIFLGGCLGVVALTLRSRLVPHPHYRVLDLNRAVYVIVRVTLSFWAASQVYIAAGGRLPLGQLPEVLAVETLVLPLVIYGLVYLTLYFSIFLLELYSEHYVVPQIIRADFSRIAVILLLPLPFTVLGAEIITVLNTPSQIILFTGLVLIVMGLYALSLSEYRLREQLAEVSAMSAERTEELVTLNQIASLLSGTLSPTSVLDIVISSASTISNANAMAVYLFDEITPNTLTMVRSAGLSERFISTAPAPIGYQKVNGQSPHLSPVTIKDVRTDPRSQALRSLLQAENKTSFVEIPLEIGDKSLGMLIFYYTSVITLSSDKVELLKTYATQAAQAINNARLFANTDEAFQRSVEQLLILASIGRVLTSTVDLKNICDIVLMQVMEATKADAGMVLLQDEITQRSLLISHVGYPMTIINSLDTVLESIQGQVLKTGESRRLDSVLHEIDYRQINPMTQSLLCVPITRGRDVLGAISLESYRHNGFSEEDSHFVSQVANQAVIAIDNARLFDSIMEARDRLQVILDAMEEGIVLIDERDTVALANPRIDLIGLWQSEMLSNTVVELAEAADLNFVERAGFASREEAIGLMDGLRQKKVYPPVNYVVQGEHGVLHIRRQIISLKSKDGKIIGALLIFYNKTEEEELAKAREELSRMIVHDLRSPLTAVTTSLKLMHDIVPKDAKFYPLVETATDASRRAIRKLLGRVDSILDIAKMESGQLSVEREITELLPLIVNVIQELTPLAQELEISIEPKIGAAFPPLDIDGDKIERLILNLVDNALKYSPRQSKILVRSHTPEQDGAAGGYVRIDVVDHGPGIPSEYKATLFDRFVQIEGRRKVRRGVGLGLTFCRMVVEAHGGRIWIEDNPEGGSVFCFTLPFVDAGEAKE